MNDKESLPYAPLSWTYSISGDVLAEHVESIPVELNRGLPSSGFRSRPSTGSCHCRGVRKSPQAFYDDFSVISPSLAVVLQTPRTSLGDRIQRNCEAAEQVRVP